MNENQDLETLRRSLWDLHYGLLDEAEAEALRARVSSDPAAARLYAFIEIQTEAISAAAVPIPDSKQLFERGDSGFADRYEDRRVRRRRFFGGLTLVGGALAVLLFLTFSTLNVYWSPDSPVRPEAIAAAQTELLNEYPRLIVVGPPALVAETPSELQVIVQRLDGAALNAAVNVELATADGEKILSQRTALSERRAARIPLPSVALGDAYRLEVALQAETENGTHAAIETADRLSTWLSVRQPQKLRFVSTDRTLYRSGDWCFYREVTLPIAYFEGSDREVKSQPAFDLADVPAKSKMSRGKDSLSELEPKANSSRPLGDVALPEVRWGVAKLADDFFVHVPGTVPAASGEGSIAMGGSVAANASLGVDGVGPSSADLAIAEKSLRKELEESVLSEHAAGGAPSSKAVAGKLAKRSQEIESVPEQVAPAESNALETENASRETSLYVETISANGRLISQRFVTADPAKHRFEGDEDAAAYFDGLDFEGEYEIEWYDYGTAPPQRVRRAVRNREVRRKLELSADFDRAWYAAGDDIELTIRTANESGENVAGAVLGVRAEALPSEDSLAPELLSPAIDRWYTAGASDTQFTSAGRFTQPNFASQRESLPLVFDNGADQRKRFEQAHTAWHTKRDLRRQYQSLILLFGSSGGYFLLLIAALLKWTPRAVWWVPIGAGLSLTFLVGVVWLAGGGYDEPALRLKAMIPYGVQTSRPLSPGGDSRSEDFFAGRGVSQEVEFSLNGIVKSAPAGKTVTEDFLVLRTPESNEGTAFSFGVMPLDRLAQVDERRNAQVDKMSDALARDREKPELRPEERNAAPATASGGAPAAIAATPRVSVPKPAAGPVASPAAAAPAAAPALPAAKTAGDAIAEVAKKSTEALEAVRAREPEFSKEPDGLPPMPRAVYWHPYVSADENGSAKVRWTLPENAAIDPGTQSLRITIDAHGDGRLGSLELSVPLKSFEKRWREKNADLFEFKLTN